MLSCFRITLLVCLVAAAHAHALKPDVGPAEIPRPERVILFALDGLSLTGLKQASTPRLDELSNEGVFIERSRGVLPSKSAPNWASILTGSWPDDHGIHSNQWWWFRWHRRLCHPTLFTAFRKQDEHAKTAAVYEWKQFERLWAEGDVDTSVWSSDAKNTVSKVKRILEKRPPHFLVVHLLQADLMGHEYGWGSRPYLDAISRVDAQLGEILDKLKALGLESKTLVIVASDHGGVGKSHGEASDTELITPVIFKGPGIVAGGRWSKAIRNVDIAATITKAFDLPPLIPKRGKSLDALWLQVQ
jgi:predicted AlkP superfamily pyrophosphatase or phosphodiesterase